jgi:hypothetical protein
MTETDQSRLTMEEQAFLQALSDEVTATRDPSRASYDHEQVVGCLRIIDKLAGDRPQCICGNGEAEEDRMAVLRCPVHGSLAPGDKPPADSIRVWTCDRCGQRWLFCPATDPHGRDFARCYGAVLERVYVPAGAEPDREAMAHLVMETLGQAEYGGDRIDGDEARNVVDALYPVRLEPAREAMVQQVRAVLDAAPTATECTCPPEDNSRCDACKDQWADAVVDALYPSKL